jgi:hypothetical protein
MRETTDGNAADDTLMVDQGILLELPYGVINEILFQIKNIPVEEKHYAHTIRDSYLGSPVYSVIRNKCHF